MSAPLATWLDRDGALLRLRLSRPKANILDAEMIAALDAAFAEHVDNPQLKTVLIDAEGPHFSFGASVEEHMPEGCEQMLVALHALIRRMVECPVPILVSIRGRCLGGGLELATAGHRLFASADAELGQPEMMLGVFAPAASCLLPERIGQAAAEDLLWSARTIPATEAREIGLIDVIDPDPEEAALSWFDKHLSGKSASSLRRAVRAARLDLAERISAKLERVERLYLDDLMKTHDAVEGLNAFLEKRPANWSNQ